MRIPTGLDSNLRFMDLTFVLLLIVFVVLIVVNPIYRNSKMFHRNMFHTRDVTSMGLVANVEVFFVKDKELGTLVGLVFKGGDDDQRMSITPTEALHLAEMLESEANEASLAKRSGKT